MKKLTKLKGTELYVTRRDILDDMEKEIINDLKQKYRTNDDAIVVEHSGKLVLYEESLYHHVESNYYEIPEKEVNLLKAIRMLRQNIDLI